jgi:hypothetical protein
LYALKRSYVLVSQIGWSGFWSMQGAKIYFAELSLAKSDGPVLETEWYRISRSSDNLGEMTTEEPDDCRTPLIHYLKNHCHITDRKVHQQALKYAMLDNTLYRQTIDGLLLKCLSLDESRIAMGEVHEEICGTHQSAHKMK